MKSTFQELSGVGRSVTDEYLKDSPESHTFEAANEWSRSIQYAHLQKQMVRPIRS